MPSVIWGKPGTPVENITFKDINIRYKGGHPVSEATLRPVENDERFPRKVGDIPSYAWYLRHVKNVYFTDCEFDFEQNDDRPAFVIDEGNIVKLNNVKLKKGDGIDYRIEIRETVSDFAILNCFLLPDVDTTVANKRY